MSSFEKEQYCIYKIYSENGLLYIGKTTGSLNQALHGHIFQEPKYRLIHADAIEKIEFAFFPTAADMTVCHCYLVNLLKPVLNQKDKTEDPLTLQISTPAFLPYPCSMLNKWRKEIQKKEDSQLHVCQLKRQLQEETNHRRRMIFEDETLTLQEKEALWIDWLIHVYEPLRNGLY